MIKVKVKAPWFDSKGLHKIGDITEVETAAFDPLRMTEIREKATREPEPEPEVKPMKSGKTTKKSTKRE